MPSKLPEGWQEMMLGQLADINSESLPASTEPAQRIRYIDIAAVAGPSDLQETKHLSFGDAPSRARRIVRLNDILVSTVRPYLRSFCMVQEDANDMVASTGFSVIRSRSIADPYFLYQHILSEYFVKHLVPRMKGSNYPAVTAKDVAEYTLLLPPLPEQRRIAEVLSSVDGAIQATQAVIEQTRKVKQGVLKRMLTKGIRHTRFKQTEIGEIPESWEITTASEVCAQISVGIVVQPAQYYVESGVKCFRSANVREGYIEDKNWVYISPESNEILAKSKLHSGDVLVVRSGYTGTSCVVTNEFEGANCVDIIFARPKKKIINPHFLSAFINSPVGREQVLRSEGGLAQKHFNVGEMKKMRLALPSLNEQQEIADRILHHLDYERMVNEEVERLEQLKAALMSDLLTGRKRVLTDDIAAAE